MITDLCSYLIKDILQGICLLDDFDRTIFVNDSLVEMLGISREEMQKQSILSFMDEESLHIASANLELCRAGIKVQQDLKFRRRDGSDLWAIVSLNPLFDSTEKSKGTLAIITDITERKNTEQILREEVEKLAIKTRTKDHFLAIVAHELRTPLTAIKGWSEVLLSRKVDADTAIRGLKIIRHNAELQNQLIEDLLDLSRIIRGNLNLNIYPMNLVVIVSSAIETLRQAAEAKKIQLSSISDFSGSQILGDPDRLQQVLLNLLSNAIKFTPEGGQVKIKLERINSVAQIQVIDTGIGIAADFLPDIFNTFSQADSASKRGYSGLGLGLAIVRQLVELHNGSICAASEGEGKGATFTVQLPIAVNYPKRVNLELPNQKKPVIQHHSTESDNNGQKKSSTNAAELLMSYVAYYVSRGKTVISPLTGLVCFTGTVYNYQGYHINFQSFWQQLQQRNDWNELYIEGDNCCFREFLNGSYTVTECARCNLPIPTVEGHAYAVPNCALCDDSLMCEKAKSDPESNYCANELEITRVLAIGTNPNDLNQQKKLFSVNRFQVNFVLTPEEITP